jgi:hypothetical protein
MGDPETRGSERFLGARLTFAAPTPAPSSTPSSTRAAMAKTAWRRRFMSGLG